VALGLPKADAFKRMTVDAATTTGKKITTRAADIDAAKDDLCKALIDDDQQKAAETLGHIDYRYYVERLADALAKDGDNQGASKVLTDLRDTLAARNVRADVIAQIAQKATAARPPRRRD
jgi:hypothetical protein